MVENLLSIRGDHKIPYIYTFLNLTFIFNYSTLNKDRCFSRVIIFVVRLGQTRLLSFRAILFCVCRRVPNIAQTRKFIYQITHSRVHLVQCYVFDCFARRFELKMLIILKNQTWHTIIMEWAIYKKDNTKIPFGTLDRTRDHEERYAY